jgi:hypothetical protein
MMIRLKNFQMKMMMLGMMVVLKLLHWINLMVLEMMVLVLNLNLIIQMVMMEMMILRLLHLMQIEMNLHYWILRSNKKRMSH